MKRSLISLLILPICSFTMASYTVIYPLSNINFKNNENSDWVKTQPAISEWIFSKDYYNCGIALPVTDSIDKGQEFEQTVSGCSQDKTRTIQQREYNAKTSEYRNIGVAELETKTETNLNYRQTAYGTGSNESYTIAYGAGSISSNGSRFVGAYARSNTAADIGIKSMNSDNQRVLVYYSSPSATSCKLYLGVTEAKGWTPNTTTNLNTALTFVDKYKYIDIYNANNTLFKRYDFTMAGSISNKDGAFKALTVPCTDMNSFYTNTSLYSKAVLNTLPGNN